MRKAQLSHYRKRLNYEKVIGEKTGVDSDHFCGWFYLILISRIKDADPDAASQVFHHCW